MLISFESNVIREAPPWHVIMHHGSCWKSSGETKNGERENHKKEKEKNDTASLQLSKI